MDATSTQRPASRPMTRAEQKKQTRQALQDAADRLFAEQGVANTTVREIAEAAGVTERTFFRYFGTKEDLILPRAFSWMPWFRAAVRERPAEEPPFIAIRNTLIGFLPAITRTDAASPLALFADAPPVDRVRSLSAARTLMARLEAELADVIEDRITHAHGETTRQGEASEQTEPPIDVRFEADIMARTSVAIFRGVMLRDAELTRRGTPDRPSLLTLIDQAFAVVS